MSPAPPKFLPVSATPQPDKRQSSQRRHSIEKESPTSVRPFLPPSRQSSKSLVRYLVEAISIGLSVYDRSLSSKWLKKKSKYKSRYSEAFLNAVHDPPVGNMQSVGWNISLANQNEWNPIIVVTSINSTRRTIRLLNLLLSCDRPLVCSEVTGFLWLWAWSYDSSEVDGSNWKHRTALYEKDLGQVGLFSLFMYFFFFFFFFFQHCQTQSF